jgi:hypothetical protein
LLYHYTDASGLLAILSSQVIWATAVEYLNDAQELVYARGVLRDALNFRLEQLPEPPADLKPGDHSKRRIHRLTQVVLALDRLDYDSGVFVTCLSGRRDSPSQWRAYGGYAIGFRASSLSKLTYEQQGPPGEEAYSVRRSFELHRVKYGVDEQTTTLLQDVAAEIDDAPIAGLGAGFQGVAKLHARALPHLAVVKHPSFEEEHEWRLVSSSEVWKGIASFRVGRLGLTPFLPVPFEKEAIAEIVVGPNSEIALRKAGVRQCLQSLKYQVNELNQSGFGHGVTVSVSDTPLRP